MRRAPFVIGGTAAGLALVLSFHTSSPSLAVSAGAPGTTSTPSGSTTSAAPPPRGSTGSAASPTAPSTTAPSGATTPSTSASTTAAPSTTSPPTTAARSTTTTAPATRSATSQPIYYRYGVLELKVTVSGNRIRSISTAEDQATDPRSAEINAQAIPMLHDQAMQAQSANIDGVSGATYTSEAYVQSLQAPLDQLGYKG